jgi:ketosteroid isomerase-like protein
MSDERVRDELDIRQLVANLVFQSDAGELDDYLALFTEDAVWEVPANAASGVPAAHCAGRDEIQASVEGRRALGVQGPGTGAMHHITTQCIEVSGDEASGHIYYQFVGMVEGRPTVRTVGQYRDRYRRTADGWKLSHRVVLIS